MSKKTNRLGWVVGSIAIFAVSILIVPQLINKVSSAAYKASNKNLRDEEIFPEPIIEKRNKINTEEDSEDDGI